MTPQEARQAKRQRIAARQKEQRIARRVHDREVAARQTQAPAAPTATPTAPAAAQPTYGHSPGAGSWSTVTIGGGETVPTNSMFFQREEQATPAAQSFPIGDIQNRRQPAPGQPAPVQPAPGMMQDPANPAPSPSTDQGKFFNGVMAKHEAGELTDEQIGMVKNQWNSGRLTPEQNAQVYDQFMKPTSQSSDSYETINNPVDAGTGSWRATDHGGEYNAQYSLDYGTQRLNDTRGTGDNKNKTNEISQWMVDTRTAARKDPEAFAGWVEANPEEAIRYYALQAQPRWNGDAGDKAVAKENQAIADSLAYYHAIDQGYGKDAKKDGKMIASNFDTFNDLTNEGGPGDIWKLGGASSLPGGINDFIEDNPLAAVGMVATAVLAGPAAGALVNAGYSAAAAGAIVGAGSSAINTALQGGDVGDIIEGAAKGGVVGGAAGWASGATANVGGAGEGSSILGLDEVAKVPQKVVEGSTIMDKLIDAGKGAKDVLSAGSRYEPWGEVKAPTIGGTTVGSKDGWHWEVNDEGVFKAVEDRPDMEGGGGGGDTGGMMSGGPGIPGNQVPYEYEPGVNPSGSTGSGLGGELQATEGQAEEGTNLGLLGLLGAGVGDRTLSTGPGSGAAAGAGSAGTGTSTVTSTGTGTGTGTGEGGGTGDGQGDGSGSGEGDGMGYEAAAGMLAAGAGASEFKPFMATIETNFPVLSKLNLQPKDYLKMLIGRMNA